MDTKNTLWDQLFRPKELEALDAELLEAAKKGEAPKVHSLIDRGASIHAGTCNEVFINAIRSGNVDTVAVLIEKGCKVNSTDFNGWTMLMYAAQSGHEKVVSFLIVKGALVNKACFELGLTALMFAVMNNHFNATKILIEQKANVNAHTTSTFQTPLFHAIQNENREIYDLLISHGAELEMTIKLTEKWNQQKYEPKVLIYSDIRSKKDTNIINNGPDFKSNTLPKFKYY